MSETQVQIADQAREPGGGPYRNLWVPLVVIPACIVMMLVLVFALFGAIAGDVASPASNLERVLHGGSNERRQALYNLVAQLRDNHVAQREGKAPPHPLEAGFLEEVEGAVAELGEENPEIRLTLGILLATMGDPEGTRVLSEVLRTSDEDDPDGQTRFYALVNLGLAGDPAATAAILPFLEHEDPGLRTAAAGALQKMRGEASREALVRVLEDPVLEVRLTAAITLSKLEPPDERAAPVLREALAPELYRAENAKDRSRFRQAELISNARVQAMVALGRLGPLAEDRERLLEMQSDSDPGVAEAARAALAGDYKGGGQ